MSGGFSAHQSEKQNRYYIFIGKIKGKAAKEKKINFLEIDPVPKVCKYLV